MSDIVSRTEKFDADATDWHGAAASMLDDLREDYVVESVATVNCEHTTPGDVWYVTVEVRVADE